MYPIDRRLEYEIMLKLILMPNRSVQLVDKFAKTESPYENIFPGNMGKITSFCTNYPEIQNCKLLKFKNPNIYKKQQ